MHFLRKKGGILHAVVGSSQNKAVFWDLELLGNEALIPFFVAERKCLEQNFLELSSLLATQAGIKSQLIPFHEYT